MDRRPQILAILVHLARVSAVAALLLLIPSPRSDSSDGEDVANPPSIELIRGALADAAQVDPNQSANGFWTVSDASGDPIARVARTLPEASEVIGYRGPSEAMILLDHELKLIGVDLIQSADTDEHVAAVRGDVDFFKQFRSWTWTGPEAGTPIDAVSGATLTSLALAKGVLKRIGGDRPSLVFPDAVAVDELTGWFPDAVKTRVRHDRIVVSDRGGQSIGSVIRTGPLADSVIGYQGPTELLIKVEPTAATAGGDDLQRDDLQREESTFTVVDIKIRSSFDNEPYVGYCKTEYGFWSLFEGKTIRALSAMDLEEAGVEGVSGATMTSMAIGETLVAATNAFEQRAEARRTSEAQRTSTWNRLRTGWLSVLEVRPTSADWACVVVLCLIPLFRIRGWFRSRRLRTMWLIAVIGVIGIWSGNLISMALVAGWSAGGVAWRLAPALAAIVIVALLAPIFGKANPYCNHLCPHGAIQQLVRPTKKSKRYWTPPRRLIMLLKYLPGLLLVFAYLALLRFPSTDLSSWEPFHAYLYRIAPWTAIALAGATILFSAFVPMGYCRLGCPTGRLLDHLRRSASSDRFTLADAVAAGLLVLAILSTTLTHSG